MPEAELNSITLSQAGNVMVPSASQGSLASTLIANGFNTNALRAHAALKKEDWLHLDQAVMQPVRQRMTAVADLFAAGNVMDLKNALGITSVEHQTHSAMSPARADMTPTTDTDRDKVLYGLGRTPMPVVHKDFRLDIRELEASRNRGTPLDTTSVEEAARTVAEKIEDMVFNGDPGVGLTGYLNSPARQVSAKSTAEIWANANVNGEAILNDMAAQLGHLRDNRRYGPYVVYVDSNTWTKLVIDYKAGSDKSILNRMLELPEITEVKPAYNLPDTGMTVLVIQMTSDVVDIINGFAPKVIMWEEKGGLELNMKVMAIMVPRIRTDYSGSKGILQIG